MMKFFPDLKIDLQDSIKKQSLLDIALDADGAFLKSLHEQGSLSKILEYDAPSDYIRE